MKASLYHYKTLRESPSEAELTSHKLMIRANMIKPLASGIYSWLPLGNKVLKKVEKIIREEMDSNGCLEVLMPMVQPKDLWEETGRSKGATVGCRARHGRGHCGHQEDHHH